MGFFNRFLLLYALMVGIMTLAFVYANAHYYTGTGKDPLGLLIGYIALLSAGAIIISRKDKRNNWSGFSYHLVTYIILGGFAAAAVYSDDYEYTKPELLHMVLLIMAVWGLVLLIHLGIHFILKHNNKT